MKMISKSCNGGLYMLLRGGARDLLFASMEREEVHRCFLFGRPVNESKCKCVKDQRV